jgi:hypothetical protein
MNKKRSKPLNEQEEEDLFEAIKNAEPADIQIDLGPYTVFSLRVPNELLAELCDQAKKRNVKMSTYARQLIEQGLAVEPDAQLRIMTTVINNIAHQLPPTKSKKSA